MLEKAKKSYYVGSGSLGCFCFVSFFCLSVFVVSSQEIHRPGRNLFDDLNSNFMYIKDLVFLWEKTLNPSASVEVRSVQREPEAVPWKGAISVLRCQPPARLRPPGHPGP